MFRKILRFVGWTFFVITVLLIAVALLVRVPAVQNRIAQKAITYLEEKIGTDVGLDRIVIDFPKKIVIEGLYLQDVNRDTLLYAGRIGVDASMLKLFRNEIELSQIQITDANARVIRAMDSTFNFDYIVDAFATEDTIEVTPVDTTASQWTFSIGDVELRTVRFLYKDTLGGMKASGKIGSLDIDADKIDPMNLLVNLDELEINNTNISYQEYALTDINLSVSDIKLDTTSIEAKFEEFSFHEKRGLTLQKLVGELKLNKEEAYVKSFEILLGNSHLFLDGNANLVDSVGDITIRKSQISIDDILSFQPDLLDSLPLNLPKSMMVFVEARAHGGLKEAIVELLEVSMLDSTRLSLTGKAKRADVLDVDLKEFHTTLTDVKKILADSLLPDSLDLPTWVNLEGKMTGNIKRPVVMSTLRTDKGSVVIDGRFDLANQLPSYNAKISGREIAAGKLAGQNSLGNVNFDLAVDGRGFTTNDIQTRIDLVVHDITYNSYTFRDFTVNGSIDRFMFSGRASLDDENLKFVLDGDLDYNGDVPSYKVEFDLQNIDFQKLKLTERPLKARLTVGADLQTSDFKVMNGHLDIRKVGVFNGEKLYSVDSMLFASLDQKGHSTMSIRSDILSGDFEGTFNIFSIGEVLAAHFQQYFSNGKKVEADAEDTPQNFTFDLKVTNTDLITEVLVPGLDPFTPGVIRGEFDSREAVLDLEFRMPKLRYNGIGVDSLIFLVDSDSSELRYLAKVKNLAADTIAIHEVNLVGAIAKDIIKTSFNILDSLEEKKYSVGARISVDEQLMNIRLDSGMILNYSTWSVPTDNRLLIGENVIATNNFEIMKQGQKVMMIGDTRNDAAITLRFEDLELSNFTRVIQGVVPASGELNGDFKFTTSGGDEFNSKLSIAGLTVLQIPIGDLTLGIDHKEDRYNVAMNLRGNRTNLETKGYYGGPKGSEVLDLVADIHQLNMEAVQAFSVGQITNATGVLKGKMSVTGKPTHPDITGSLTFSDVSLISTFLNSQFRLKNETISIRNDNISLNNFTIADASGNTAQLKGNVKITNYTNPTFDLTLTTKGFQVLDTHEGDNDLFYGKVKINATARISGSAEQPKADFKLGFTDDTNLTYVVPTSEKGVLEAKGIVTFVDKDAANDPFLAKLKAEDSIRSTAATGIEVSAVIDLSDKEVLNIVVDPLSGDRLTVQGNSSLTFNMTPTGNMNLSGRYEITKGSYNISFYNLVKRQFVIEKGSTITWAGDPLNATMDIRASNLVETSPLELLMVGDANANTNFNQRLPFLVFLNIKGQLLAPQISFALDMPEDKRNAFGGMLYSKLQDINSRESDLNKQVFALLILKRFVADNPLASSSGGGASSAARTSVSRILSDQLNRLSQNVKGVQLSVDIKSYEQSSLEGGTQATTKAQLGVSKSLFGNRLVVKLSGNVDIEGENAGSGNVSDYIGDLALEYKLTEDGRFRITGFRNSNYDMIDGELTETGAGLIYIKDYNTLRELFKSNEDETP